MEREQQKKERKKKEKKEKEKKKKLKWWLKKLGRGTKKSQR